MWLHGRIILGMPLVETYDSQTKAIGSDDPGLRSETGADIGIAEVGGAAGRLSVNGQVLVDALVDPKQLLGWVEGRNCCLTGSFLPCSRKAVTPCLPRTHLPGAPRELVWAFHSIT